MKKTVSLLAAFAVLTCMIMVEQGACGQAFAAEEAFPNHGEGNWGIVDPQTGKHTGYFWLSLPAGEHRLDQIL